jgi:hypothetical protein
MRARVLPVLLLVACHAPRPGPPPAASAPTYRIVDATPPFWRFWQEARDEAPEAAARRFRAVVVAAHPPLFAPTVIGRDPSQRRDDLDERLPAFLADLPPRIAVMRRLSDSIARELAAHDRAFRAAFPDMKWAGTVYFTVSLDAFDGAMREVDGRMALLFGIDKMAKLHGDQIDLAPMFHHELFHTYHFDVNPPPDLPDDAPRGLLEPLWSEGLAVYVARRLNPRATARQLLLSDELIAATDARLPALAAELRKNLDLSTPETYRDFFLGAGKRDDVPRRCAYYIGLKVVEKVAVDRDLPALARLRAAPLRQAVDDALARLAAPPR